GAEQAPGAGEHQAAQEGLHDDLELPDLQHGRAFAPTPPAEQVGDGDHAEGDGAGDEHRLGRGVACGLLAVADHLGERRLEIVAGDPPSVGLDRHDYSCSSLWFVAGAVPRRAAWPWVIRQADSPMTAAASAATIR